MLASLHQLSKSFTNSHKPNQTMLLSYPKPSYSDFVASGTSQFLFFQPDFIFFIYHKIGLDNIELLSFCRSLLKRKMLLDLS